MLYVFALIGFLSVYGVKLSKKNDAQTQVMLQPQEPIACGSSVSGSTLGAANDYGNAAGDYAYSLVLPTATSVTLDSCGSGFDTYLRVFAADGTQVCFCDDCGPCGLQTVLQCDLAAGEYLVVVDGYSRSEGDFDVAVRCVVPTEPIGCDSVVSGSTAGLVNGYGNAAGDRAYSLVLPAAASVTLDSCGSGFDTFLRVFAADGTLVCFCDDCGPCGLQTVLECDLAGGEYLVVVDGYSSSEGDFNLVLSCSASVGCGESVVGSTEGAINVVGNSAGDSLHSFSLDAQSVVTLDSCGSGFDTYLRVYDYTLSTEYCACDDCGPCGLQTVLECELDAGDYVIVVDGYSNREGEYNVAVGCVAVPPEPIECGSDLIGSTAGNVNVYGNLAGDSVYSLSLAEDRTVTLNSCDSGFDTWLRILNEDGSAEVCGCDDCGDCGLRTVLDCELVAGEYLVVVDGYSSSEGDFNVAVSCVVPPEPIGCGSVVSGSTVGLANGYGNAAGDRAYNLVLTAAASVTLDSCGSGFDTYLRVFAADGTEVCFCDDCGPCGLQTVLECDLAGGEYLVVVDGYSSSEGDFNLALSCSASVGCGEAVSGSNVGSVNVVGSAAGDSLYSFSLDAHSIVTLNSCESNFDTWLRVYDSTLTTQVCGCDDCGACGLQTVLECELNAGDYIIVVDGYSNSEGDFDVAVSCASPFEPIGCGSAVNGSTVGNANYYGNAAGDYVYSLSLSQAAEFTLDSCGSNFDTYLRVFTSDGLTQVCGCDDCGDCGLQTVLYCALDAGEYLVVVDGYSSGEGDFNLALSCWSVGCGGSVVGSTVGAANVIGNPAGDALYSFSLDAGGIVTVSSCESNFDTYLRVFDSSLNTQVCGCDDCGSCGLQTVLECELNAGDYVIVVDGYSNSEGDFDVSVTC